MNCQAVRELYRKLTIINMKNMELNNKFEVIPAIDIINGECVRLSMGDYDRVKRYSTNPLEIALWFESLGFKKLHIVDLEGAKQESPVNLAVLKKIASNTSLEIQFGGGVKTQAIAKQVFDSGAHSIICGSIAVTNLEIMRDLIDNYGAKNIILGLDIKEGKIAIKGWKEQSNNNIYEFISTYTSLGVSRVICTDISKDGMLLGPAYELYKDLSARFSALTIIASGGVSSEKDIFSLASTGASGVVVGKAFYENKINIEELQKWLQNE